MRKYLKPYKAKTSKKIKQIEIFYYFNSQLLNLEFYKFVTVNEPNTKKLRDSCLKYQNALTDHMIKLNPNNMDQYYKLRDEYVNCKNKIKI